MKVALLTIHSRVSPVFEATSNWLKINVTTRESLISSHTHFKTKNELDMANELLNENIEMVICGAIPYYLEKILINQGCSVLSFIAGDVNEVIEALHLNLLDNPKFRMPGCKKRKQRGNTSLCRRTVNR